jgi:hypothetical protein
MSQSKVSGSWRLNEKTAEGKERIIEAVVFYRKGEGYYLSLRGKEHLTGDLYCHSICPAIIESPIEAAKRFSAAKLASIVLNFAAGNLSYVDSLTKFCEANNVTLKGKNDEVHAN